jgi:hypothetical protein
MPHDIKDFAVTHTVVKGVVGSNAYGTSLGSGDNDFLGICIEPKDYLIGITSPFNEYVYRTAKEGERSTPGDTDLTIYSARKWMRLACKGNPSILGLMFSPNYEVYREPFASALMKHPQWYMTRKTAGSFLGYMKAQRQSLLGQRGRRTNRPELVEKHGYDCYSDDTEFLTRQGWKLYDDIADDEALATIRSDGSVEFQIPIERVSKLYNGPMMELTHRYSHALVTPNHRMFVSRVVRGSNGDFGYRYRPEVANWSFIPAQDLNSGFYHVRVAGTPREDEYPISDATLAVYGAYLSEGCVAKRRTGIPSVLAFTQNVGGRLKPHLALVASEYPIRQYTYARADRENRHTVTTLADRELAPKVAEECGEGSRNKHLPEWAFDLSSRQADVLLKVLLDGDGTLNKNGYWVYYSISRRLAGDIQALAIIASHRANMWGPYQDGMYQVMIQDTGKEIEAIRNHYSLKETTPRSQRIVCFTVPNETLVTRRHGRVAMHGNTKFAYHLIRLGYQGVEFLSDGTMTQPLPQKQLDVIMRIRHGETDLDSVIDLSKAQEMLVEKIKATLPEDPPYPLINDTLIAVYETYWNQEYA